VYRGHPHGAGTETGSAVHETRDECIREAEQRIELLRTYDELGVPRWKAVA
jgi:hypothetical protein